MLHALAVVNPEVLGDKVDVDRDVDKRGGQGEKGVVLLHCCLHLDHQLVAGHRNVREAASWVSLEVLGDLALAQLRDTQEGLAQGFGRDRRLRAPWVKVLLAEGAQQDVHLLLRERRPQHLYEEEPQVPELQAAVLVLAQRFDEALHVLLGEVLGSPLVQLLHGGETGSLPKALTQLLRHREAGSIVVASAACAVQEVLVMPAGPAPLPQGVAVPQREVGVSPAPCRS
mmetsp:Transcript_66370/g.194657  ORF Transcript_66370/g.194657 Transcript_66370/m.194657 type:complete len:228 (+) Transcript_66370:3006-3689(+)